MPNSKLLRELKEIQSRNKTDYENPPKETKEDADQNSLTKEAHNRKIEEYRLHNPKSHAIHELLGVFKTLETDQKAKQRDGLLKHCVCGLWFLVVSLISFIVLRGFGYLKIELSVFIGSLTGIVGSIFVVLRIAAKYLYSDDKSKILDVISKIACNKEE